MVAHPGFVPIELRWDGEGPIPDAYTLAMDRGVPIGGTVRDERGRPIAGARVHLQVGATPAAGRARALPGPRRRHRRRGDRRPGPMALRGPARLGGTRRPARARDDPSRPRRGLKQTVTAEALRAFAAAGVMKTGRSLSGTVLSPTGRPVAGATVIVQSRSDRPAPGASRPIATGRFRTGPFIDPSWAEFTMVVQADGFASVAQVLLVPPEIPPQSIKLSPRRPLHGRVVDAQGRPVPGAVVRSPTEFGYAGLDWEAETGADGRFVWYEAPATGSYMLNVVKPPFRQIIAAHGPRRVGRSHAHPAPPAATCTARSPTPRPAGRSSGSSLISGSGPHPARLAAGLDLGLAPPVRRRQVRPDRLGHRAGWFRSIRIEAEGYEPAEFLGFPDSLEDVAHDFKLRKAAPLAGIVRGPDGRPLAGVDVALQRVGLRRPDRERAAESPFGPESERAGSGPARTVVIRSGRRDSRVSVIAVHDAGIRPPFGRRAGRLDRSHPRALGADRRGREDRQKPAPGRRWPVWLLEPIPARPLRDPDR